MLIEVCWPPKHFLIKLVNRTFLGINLILIDSIDGQPNLTNLTRQAIIDITTRINVHGG